MINTRTHSIPGGAINDPVIHSMGLKMECNTRRFATDDRRELQYRVEVQNRVYKKEMAALDAEIAKLQRMLDSTSTASSLSALSERSALLLHSLQQQQDIVIVSPDCPEKVQLQPQQLARNLSIGGGLPLLLLSVLPPVIPRASWPSAQPSPASAIGASCPAVSFSSQPQLDTHRVSQAVTRLPAVDLFNLRLTHQQATAEGQRQQTAGLIGRLRGLFAASPQTATPSAGLTPPSERRDSGASVGEGTMRKHLNKLTGLMALNQTVTASCNALHKTNGLLAHQPQHQQPNQQCTKSGSALNEPFVVSDEFGRFEAQRIVVFQLPRQTSHSIPAGRRARVKGSPRFPHRIVPSRGSLNALSLVQSNAFRLPSKCKSWDESSSFTSASSSNSSISSSAAASSVVSAPTVTLREADSLSIISVVGTGVYDEAHMDDQ